jgi:hypothetical protein
MIVKYVVATTKDEAEELVFETGWNDEKDAQDFLTQFKQPRGYPAQCRIYRVEVVAK